MPRAGQVARATSQADVQPADQRDPARARLAWAADVRRRGVASPTERRRVFSSSLTVHDEPPDALAFLEFFTVVAEAEPAKHAVGGVGLGPRARDDGVDVG